MQTILINIIIADYCKTKTLLLNRLSIIIKKKRQTHTDVLIWVHNNILLQIKYIEIRVIEMTLEDKMFDKVRYEMACSTN